MYAHEANELFDLIGVAANTTAIDVGCGAMGVLHLLAERVGTDGRVVGLDREARMVEFGRQLAEQRGLAVEFIEADATATGLPDRAFDLVHARTLLLNVQNPEQILNEMVRIATPGGVVAAQEPDASAWNCDPPHPAFDILRGAILSAYRRTGKDFSIGRRIARMLKDAGLYDVQVRPTTRNPGGRVLPNVPPDGRRPCPQRHRAGRRANRRRVRVLHGGASHAPRRARHDHLPANHVAGVGPSHHGDRHQLTRRLRRSSRRLRGAEPASTTAHASRRRGIFPATRGHQV